MARGSQERNGRRYPPTDGEKGEVIARETRRRYRAAGLRVPVKKVVLDPLRAWALMGEGWKFVFASDGETILAYLPPSLADRLRVGVSIEQGGARQYPTSNRVASERERTE